MAKKKNQRRNKRKKQQHKRATPSASPPAAPLWMDKEGLHALLPGDAPSADVMAVFNDNFRKELRNSPLWDEMVQKFGIEEAEDC